MSDIKYYCGRCKFPLIVSGSFASCPKCNTLLWIPKRVVEIEGLNGGELLRVAVEKAE